MSMVRLIAITASFSVAAPIVSARAVPSPSYGLPCATAVTQMCCDYSQSPTEFRMTRLWVPCAQACDFQESVCIAEDCGWSMDHYYKCLAEGNCASGPTWWSWWHTPSVSPCSLCSPPNEACKTLYNNETVTEIHCDSKGCTEDECYGSSSTFEFDNLGECGR